MLLDNLPRLNLLRLKILEDDHDKIEVLLVLHREPVVVQEERQNVLLLNLVHEEIVEPLISVRGLVCRREEIFVLP